MKILHYTFGVPPFRSGGLTKYAIDLMLKQSESDKVFMLSPGSVTLSYPIKQIVQSKSYHNITVYEIKNSVCIPLLHGVKNPLSLIGENFLLKQKNMEQFYKEVKPDVMHIHTLMGLPYELVKFLKEKGVKVVFTSHDYYGLCLKVNFMDNENKFCMEHSAEKCALCNQQAASNMFLRLRNSRHLLGLKNKLPFKRTLKFISIENRETSLTKLSEQTILNYQHLLDYYRKIFSLIDCIHFNSSVTKEVYSHYIDVSKSIVLPISHADIHDERSPKIFNSQNIRLAFIGNIAVYKGFPLLKKVLSSLTRKNINNWTLQVWGGITENDKDSTQIKYKGKYSSSELNCVFENMDVLIVPSIWKETFSLITLEALSHGVPVIVSDNVGAKDIVNEYDRAFVYKEESDLVNLLKKIMADPTLLSTYNKKIISSPWTHSHSIHIENIKQLYLSFYNEEKK